MAESTKKTLLIVLASLFTGGMIISLSLYVRAQEKERALAEIIANEGLEAEYSDVSSLESGDSLTEEEQLQLEASRVAEAQKLFESLNSTDRISRDLFAKYMALKQNGHEITPEIQAALIDDVITENVQSIKYTTYTEAQIRTTTTETPESLRAYGEVLGLILFENSPKDVESELVLLGSLIENGPNESDVQKLSLISKAYATISKQYASLTVPKSAAPLHLKLVNITSALSTNIGAFANIEKDSLYTAQNIQAYGKNFDALIALTEIYKTYFANKGIIYTDGQAGYAFTHIGE